MAAGVVQPGLVQDSDGRCWVTAAAACVDGARCRYGPHRNSAAHVGPGVTCKMVRAWESNPNIPLQVRRVPGAGTWYNLDDLRNAEHAARTGRLGRPRRSGRAAT